MASGNDTPCPIRRVDGSSGHHFFGYYNKEVWNPSGTRLLAHQVPMMTGDLTGAETAEVGYFDLADGDTFHAVGETAAWNWQMGAQLQWLNEAEGRRIVYNARCERDESAPYPGFCAVVHDLEDGSARTLPAPVYVVAPAGDYALCIDYRRFNATHPTIGYAEPGAAAPQPLAPADDGIHRMDMATGATRLIVSLDALRRFEPVPSMDEAIHWVTHIEIAPGGGRALFIHRWTRRIEDETCWLHRLFTVASDGSDLRLLECSDHPLPQLEAGFDVEGIDTFDYEKSEYQISHPTWRDDRHVMVWGPHEGAIHYQLYDDRTGAADTVGAGTLVENGHMTYSPDGAWLLTDTYPERETYVRTLILYRLATGERFDVAHLAADPALGKENRCDLHPRWSRDGRQVCVDSVHEGERQMYIVDVSSVIARPAADEGALR